MAIKVNTTHPQYDAYIYVWRLIRDFVAGPSAVKRQNTLYLPIPSSMSVVRPAPDQSGVASSRPTKEIGGFVPASTKDGSRNSNIDERVPWYYPENLAYQSYLRRARVPDISSFALRGLSGIATRKSCTIDLPESIAYLEDMATSDGFSLQEMFVFIVSQLLEVGRVGLLLDVTSDNKFVFHLYSAEAIINWKESVESGSRILKFVVLQEDDDVSDDPFCHDAQAKYIVLGRDEAGNYKSDHYKQKSVESGLEAPDLTFTPAIAGLTTKELPFLCIGSIDNTPDVDEAPLHGIVDIAQHIYMKSADLANAEFMTCNPTLYMLGVEENETPVATGSNVVLTSTNENAKIDYTKTDTSGLNHVLGHIKDLHQEAAAYGVSLLATNNGNTEAVETVRIRQSIGGANIKSAVESAGSAIEHLLNLALRWLGRPNEEVVFEPSTEFANVQMGAQEMTAFMSAFLQGGISLETLVENWRRAGMLREGDTVQDEIDRLSSSLFGASGYDENNDHVDDEESVAGDEEQTDETDDHAKGAESVDNA